MKIVTAAIIMQNDCILISKRTDSKHEGYWEFPGGKLEENETEEECLVREIQEELEISIEVQEHFHNSIYDYGDGALKLKAYRCKWVQGDIDIKYFHIIKWVLPQELLSYKLLPADIPIAEKLVEYVQNTKIS